MSNEIKEQQETLGMYIDQFKEVDDFKDIAFNKYSLWSSLEQWNHLVDSWVMAPFCDIDTKKISQESEKFSKVVVKCENGLPENSSAVKQLKNMVNSFKETMPIVIALRNDKL